MSGDHILLDLAVSVVDRLLLRGAVVEPHVSVAVDALAVETDPVQAKLACFVAGVGPGLVARALGEFVAPALLLATIGASQAGLTVQAAATPTPRS